MQVKSRNGAWHVGFVLFGHLGTDPTCVLANALECEKPRPRAACINSGPHWQLQIFHGTDNEGFIRAAFSAAECAP